MAILNCPECDGNVSTRANHCPHCGYPVLPNSNLDYNVAFIFAYDDNKLGFICIQDDQKHSHFSKTFVDIDNISDPQYSGGKLYFNARDKDTDDYGLYCLTIGLGCNTLMIGYLKRLATLKYWTYFHASNNSVIYKQNAEENKLYLIEGNSEPVKIASKVGEDYFVIHEESNSIYYIKTDKMRSLIMKDYKNDLPTVCDNYVCVIKADKDFLYYMKYEEKRDSFFLKRITLGRCQPDDFIYEIGKQPAYPFVVSGNYLFDCDSGRFINLETKESIFYKVPDDCMPARTVISGDSAYLILKDRYCTINKLVLTEFEDNGHGKALKSCKSLDFINFGVGTDREFIRIKDGKII